MLSRQNILIVHFSLVLLLFSSISLAAEIQLGNNQPLPNISWQDGEDKTHFLDDSNGKPRILHFWAAWCIPCREEMPKMLAWKNDNSDILVIPLSMDQRMAQAKFFVKKLKLEMPPLLVNKEDRNKIGVPALPYTLIISKEGTLLASIKGIAHWEEAQFSQRIQYLFK